MFANNKGADQPAHPRSLISAFVIYILVSRDIKTCYKRSFTILTSLCRCAGWFWYDLIGNPVDRFCRVAAHYYNTVPKNHNPLNNLNTGIIDDSKSICTYLNSNKCLVLIIR